MTMRIVLAILLLACALPAPAQDVARMDAAAREYVDAKQFMGAVLVARGDKILFSKAYGDANLEWHVANTANTRFRLGSLTKQFTAASILLLEQRGKLSVDDPVSKFMPDAPAAWAGITLRHLLTHTSGLFNFTSLPDLNKHNPFATTPAETLSWIKDKPLDFAPGEKFNYSNSGYVLLGLVIEKASGMSYEDFLQENIFKPLGMRDSGYDSASKIIERRASGYSPGAGGLSNAEYLHMSVPFSAGGLYSTTEDLLRWENGLFGYKVISEDSVRRMTTPFKNGYAFGLAVGDADGRKVISHGGGINGFNTALAYYPDSRITVVVLANLNGGAPDELAKKLGALAHGDKLTLKSERKEIAVPSEVLDGYVGTYELRPGFDMVVRREGAQLIVQPTGQGADPLFAETTNRFFSKKVDATIEFEAGAGKPSSYMILKQGAFTGKAPRK